jgi:hypothetical protein
MDLARRPPAAGFALGDRVRSALRPEWGLGRVASPPIGGKVCVLFREAGPRTLALVHAKLERVEDGEDAWLDLLSLAPVAPDPPHTSPLRAAQRFLEAYPGGFRDPRYRARVRAPLEAAQAILRRALSRESLRAALRSRRLDPVCRAACEALAAARCVPPADAACLRRALEAGRARGRFGAALAELLYGRAAPEARVERFGAALEELGASRWSLATFFAFARHPGEHAFLRPGETPLAAAALRFDLRLRPAVNGETYGRLLALVRALSCELAELARSGLEPADAFDVHAFLRQVASSAAQAPEGRAQRAAGERSTSS